MFPLRDTIPSERPPIVVILLVVVNVAMWILELNQGPGLDAFVTTYGLVPAHFTDILFSEPWRVDQWLLPLFTSMFLHGGWMHIIGNMWFLWIFGDNVEGRLGHGQFIVFYLLCGVAAAALQVIMHPSAGIPMVGASGAISGVLGAYMILFPRSRVLTLIPIFIFPWLVELPAIFFLGLWFFEQLIAGSLSLGRAEVTGGVAWWAHAGGFVCGVLLAIGNRKPRPRRRRSEIWIE